MTIGPAYKEANKKLPQYPMLALLVALSGGYSCTTHDPVQEQSERNRRAEEQNRTNMLAAIKALPATASPDQIVSVCVDIPEIRRALASGTVDPQSEVARRCADGLVGQAKALVAEGKFAAGLESARRARLLGGGSRSGEIEELRQAATRASELEIFEQKFKEAGGLLKRNPRDALRAVQAAESALYMAQRSGAGSDTIDPLSKRLAPLATRVRRAADSAMSAPLSKAEIRERTNQANVEAKSGPAPTGPQEESPGTVKREYSCPVAAKRLIEKGWECGLNMTGMTEESLCASIDTVAIRYMSNTKSCNEFLTKMNLR